MTVPARKRQVAAKKVLPKKTYLVVDGNGPDWWTVEGDLETLRTKLEEHVDGMGHADDARDQVNDGDIEVYEIARKIGIHAETGKVAITFDTVQR